LLLELGDFVLFKNIRKSFYLAPIEPISLWSKAEQDKGESGKCVSDKAQGFCS
jgi:hypothetical protein